MGFVPTEEPIPGAKVKSVFCFAVAPEMRRTGVAKRLLERVCQDAARDGFDCVEAYPNKEFVGEAEDCAGPAGLFMECGFSVHHETEEKLIVRKQLR